MLLALLLLLQTSSGDSPSAYNGRAGRLEVRVPRQEAEPSIDGKLDDPVWGEAAILTGFSQFSPTDGVPAVDSTQVLVWYSSTAIHFGIRAFEAHGPVHATLADRDRIGADDYVQILLSTDTLESGQQRVAQVGQPSRPAAIVVGGVDHRGPGEVDGFIEIRHCAVPFESGL